MLTKSRLIQLLSMLSLLIGLFIWRTVESVGEQTPESASEVFLADETICDFSSPCDFISPLGTFTLSVDEGEIVPETWFHLTLKSEHKNWKVLRAKTVGKTMFMGKIPMRFSSISEQDGENKATAKSMVGVCATDRMLWRFDIVVEVDGTPINLYYDFLIVR